MTGFTGKVAKFGGRKIIEVPKCIREEYKPGEEVKVEKKKCV